MKNMNSRLVSPYLVDTTWMIKYYRPGRLFPGFLAVQNLTGLKRQIVWGRH